MRMSMDLVRRPWLALSSVSWALAACGSDAPPTDIEDDPQGTIQVAVALRGNATDGNGVVFAVRVPGGGEAASGGGSLETGRSLVVPPGSYEVAMLALDDHCWTESDVVSVDVTSDATVDVTFDVTCVGGFAYTSSQSVFYVGTDGQLLEENRLAPLNAHLWDPTGTHLLVSQITGGCEVYLWDVDGGAMPRLGAETSYYDPWATAWSPDGTRLAASRRSECGGGMANEAILLFDASGTTALDSLTGVNPGSVSWRPSTGELAYTTGGEVRVHSWAGGTDSVFLALDAATVSWSPDGTRVAFEVASGNQQWIAVHDDEGNEVFTTLADEYFAAEPRWAPDGSGFLFLGADLPAEGDLYFATADGSDIRNLTEQPGPDSGGTWSAGSDWFLYVAQEPDPPTGIYLGRVSDFEPRRLRVSGAFPAFRPGVDFQLDP